MTSRCGFLGLSLFVIAGCAASHPPLACRAERAGELAFGFQRAGAFFPIGSDAVNGSAFLFIDGACNYWARGADSDRVVSGTLDAALLADLNRELLTGPWSAVDGENTTGCCDGDSYGVARDEIRATSYELSPRSEVLSMLLHEADVWAERLGDLGTAVTDGPIRIELRAVSPTMTPEATVPWPLTTPLSTLVDPMVTTITTVRVFDGEDARALRAVRDSTATRHFVEGSLVVAFRSYDVVPFADAEGCLRPFFPGTCRSRW